MTSQTNNSASSIAEETNQDIPQQQVPLTSSIGGLWPPLEASFKRIKGFYTPKLITNAEELETFVNELYRLKENYLREEKDITRISLRAIIADSIPIPIKKSLLEDSLEVAFNLKGTQPAFDNSWLVYIGSNDTTREPNPNEINQYIRNVEEARDFAKREPQEIFRRLEEKGYKIRTLNLPEKEEEREIVIDQMSGLYSRFGWNRSDVINILNNQNNIIGIASYKDEIISAGIAEIATIPIGEDKQLRMAEITEAATLEDHARNGLYTAVSTMLLRDLSIRSEKGKIMGGEIDMVFGECNGNATGVLRTAAIQGRTFGTETTSEFGFDKRGFLPQHVPISGASRTTQYNDLFPTYLTREKLYKMFNI